MGLAVFGQEYSNGRYPAASRKNNAKAYGDSYSSQYPDGGDDSERVKRKIAADARFPVRLRHPIALVWNENQSRLLVANERSGTIMLLGAHPLQVLKEFDLGVRLTDLKRLPLPNQEIYAAVDGATHSLRLFKLEANELVPLETHDVPMSPVQLAVSNDGRQLAAASKWPRQISLFSIERQNPALSKPVVLNREWTLDLPFAPSRMAFGPQNNTLLAADHFGGRLGLIDLEKAELVKTLEFPANNIRGFYLDRRSEDPVLWMAGESLNPWATTFSSEVTWGVMMDNHLRQVPWSKLAAWKERQAGALGVVQSLGDETGPGGDPGPALVTKNGTSIVALSGVDRVAFNRDPSRPFVYRTRVGDRPVALALARDETRLYVANQFSDSISVLDVESMQVVEELSLGPQPALSAADRGERLFHDATLSRRGWFSCHSCHTDGHTNGQLNDNLGDDNFGAPKKILSLLGAADTPPYAWKGTAERLEDQILKSLEKTMLNDNPGEQAAADLSAYIKTLPPAPSIREARGLLDDEDLENGRLVFEAQDCNRCHRGEALTSKRTYNAGIPDEKGHAEFNPPSLRGLSQRDAYFHDNRAKSIEEALITYKHPNEETELSEEELISLLAYLASI